MPPQSPITRLIVRCPYLFLIPYVVVTVVNLVWWSRFWGVVDALIIVAGVVWFRRLRRRVAAAQRDVDDIEGVDA
jgi:hypothetical protein